SLAKSGATKAPFLSMSKEIPLPSLAISSIHRSSGWASSVSQLSQNSDGQGAPAAQGVSSYSASQHSFSKLAGRAGITRSSSAFQASPWYSASIGVDGCHHPASAHVQR